MKELICIVCPKGCHLHVDEETFQVTGNSCPRGAAYGAAELKNPTRTLTTTVAVSGGMHNRLPVRTSCAIPKNMLFDCMKEVRKVQVQAPVRAGQVIISDILGTGADLIATRDM